jgi:hypothetical protein
MMNRIHRCLGAAAALGGALLTLAVAAPAALATIPDPGGGGLEPGTQPESITVVTGGMPGWQITLIAVGAALVAAVVAVLLNRAWTARRSVPARAD